MDVCLMKASCDALTNPSAQTMLTMIEHLRNIDKSWMPRPHVPPIDPDHTENHQSIKTTPKITRALTNAHRQPLSRHPRSKNVCGSSVSSFVSKVRGHCMKILGVGTVWKKRDSRGETCRDWKTLLDILPHRK